MFQKIGNYLALKNYQYELTTALYMLEPWEKALFNSLVIIGSSLLVYATIFYLPDHLSQVAAKIAEYTTYY
ncbi:7976_t:CDS:2 [Paraglomus brasilianum]|uniref:7976_t:CDS:1 n=1 Tax=Paraglomus brasilianum TaxID=144538 RepID=A0A9N9CL92_9GLOM|nr:7976_t:CDS:2 [Paraglomus brasilianum]